MSSAKHLAATFVIAALHLVGVSGCSKDEPKPAPAASASASAEPAAAASASAAPSGSAAAGTPRSDCPKGSAGEGTFNKPCEAKGPVRLMEVGWNNKIDDKGPFFRVTNKATLVVLYGKIAVYFYDKAGKQLDTMDTTQTPPKAVPYRTCSGNMFGGVMKAGEKAVVQFSCVKKEHVPEGTAAIEAEMQSVGFADATEKKVDFYWTNPTLVTDARKKGTK